MGGLLTPENLDIVAWPPTPLLSRSLAPTLTRSGEGSIVDDYLVILFYGIHQKQSSTTYIIKMVLCVIYICIILLVIGCIDGLSHALVDCFIC